MEFEQKATKETKSPAYAHALRVVCGKPEQPQMVRMNTDTLNLCPSVPSVAKNPSYLCQTADGVALFVLFFAFCSILLANHFVHKIFATSTRL